MAEANNSTSTEPAHDTVAARDAVYTGRIGIFLLGLYLVASILIEIWLIVGFWPETISTANGETVWRKTIRIAMFSDDGDTPFTISADARIIVLALLTGGVGGMVHGLRSFMVFVGNRKLVNSWIWWYVMRPFEGAILALVFYLVIRGGLLVSPSTGTNTGNGDITNVNVFGVVAASALVGMFSQQAVEKLKEVFETLFTTAKTETDTDKLPGDTPTIAQLDPSKLAVGAESRIVTVSGTGFAKNAIARVGGEDRVATRSSETELSMTLTEADVAAAGTLQITVVNGKAGQESEPASLVIE